MRIKKLYSLICPQMPWRFKFGTSYDVPGRIRQIEYELSQQIGKPVQVRQALSVPLFFTEQVEMWLHKKFARLRAVVPFHRGYKEWYLVRNFFTVVLFLWICQQYGLNWKWWHLALLYLLPLPIDAVLLQIVIFIAQAFTALLLFYLLLCGAGVVLNSIT